MKNILAITLARGGSKGIKNKNIVKIKSKPLIAHTIIEARKSKLINEYIVSTDSLEIAKVAQYYGASVPFIRPKNLSSSKATSASALKHALNFMEKKNSIKYDYIVELMCTNPLKTVFDIPQFYTRDGDLIVSDNITGRVELYTPNLVLPDFKDEYKRFPFLLLWIL